MSFCSSPVAHVAIDARRCHSGWLDSGAPHPIFLFSRTACEHRVNTTRTMETKGYLDTHVHMHTSVFHSTLTGLEILTGAS